MKTTLIAIVFFISGTNLVQAQSFADANARLNAAIRQYKALPKNPPQMIGSIIYGYFKIKLEAAH